MESDAQLLEAYARKGQQNAFAQLVHRHLPLVFRAALRQLSFDEHRANDVAQLVFIALAKESLRLIAHPNLVGWLYTTTHRTAWRIVRSENRRRRREEETASMEFPPNNRPDEARWTEVARILDQTLETLSVRDREAIVLRYFANRSFVQIGDALQMGEDGARMRVSRALDKLRERLQLRGLTATSGGLAAFLVNEAAQGAPAAVASSIISTALQVGPVPLSLSVSIISFMATSKLAAVSASLLAAVMIGLAAYQVRVVRQAKQKWEFAQNDLRAMQQQQLAEIEKQSKSPRLPQPARHETQIDPARERGDQFLAKFPEVRREMTRSLHALFKGQYLPLYRQLGWSQDRINTFEDLMLSSIPYVRSDGKMLCVGEYLDHSQRDDRLREWLGDDVFEQIRAYRFDNGGPQVAGKVAKSLALTEQPLSPAQSQGLIAVMEQLRHSLPGGEDPWPKALPKLAEILSHQQMDGIASVYLDMEYNGALETRIRAAKATGDFVR